MAHEPYICGRVTIFADNTGEGTILGRGTQEDCERIASIVCFRYAGPKQVRKDACVVWPESQWNEFWQEEPAHAPH